MEKTTRPSLYFIGALWGGIVSAASWGLGLVPALGALGFLAACLAAVTRPRLRLWVLAACFVLLGVLRSPEAPWNRADLPGPLRGRKGVPVVLDVVLDAGAWAGSDRATGRVRAVQVGCPQLEGKRIVAIGLDRFSPLNGRTCRLRGTYTSPRMPLNPFSADRRKQYLRRGLVGAVSVKSVCARPAGGSGVGRIASIGARAGQWNRRIAGLIRRAAGGETTGMLEALVLGRRSDPARTVESGMIKAGTYHVLAISGLHVGIVILVLTSFLSCFGLGRVPRIVIMVCCVVAYVAFTGARPSAQRAGTFFVLLSACRLLQWKVDYPNCVCAAGVVLLLASPELAWDVGFQLSIAAVFGITLVVPQVVGMGGGEAGLRAKIRRSIILGLGASVSAQVFTLPIILHNFGRTSLAGPVANLGMVPLITLTVAAGIEACIAAVVWERLAVIFLRAASVLAGMCIAWAGVLTDHVNPLIFVGRPGIVRTLVYAGCVAGLTLGMPGMNRKVKIVLLLGLYTFMVVGVPTGRARHLEVTFIYVGDGDAALIEMPGGRTMLVDAGPASEDFDAGRQYVLPLLAMKGIRRIDSVVITHSHNDHYGGLGALMESVAVGEILVGALGGEPGYLAVLAAARRRGIAVRQVATGDQWVSGRVRFEVLHPSEEYTGPGVEDANAQSVVFRVSYGTVSLLFTGDVTPSVQREILARGYDARCDILKVPHHGACEGLDGGFLQALGARYAMISVGTRFSSHPCPETLALLEASGLRTLTTLANGAISIVTDGRSIAMDTCVAEPSAGPTF